MVVMCRALSVALSQSLCFAGQLGPVRETVARNMRDWTYSKKAVTLEILVNLIIVAVSAVFLVCTVAEKPNVPVRVWVAGYAVPCLVHAVLVFYEFRRQARRRRRSKIEIGLEKEFNAEGGVSVSVTVDDDGGFVIVVYHWSFAYRGDCWILIASLVWMEVGIYWVYSGGKLLSQNAPWLYWLTIVYRAYDVIFVTFFGVGMIVCGIIACFIAIRYPVAGQEGASELSVLSKYGFNTSSNGGKPSVGAGVMVPMDTGSRDSATEGVRLPEDAECCICLCSNDDGIDLRALSCNHRFHATCIEKWLKINATCPVCNNNILYGSV